jgi:hypothetical protein
LLGRLFLMLSQPSFLCSPALKAYASDCLCRARLSIDGHKNAASMNVTPRIWELRALSVIVKRTSVRRKSVSHSNHGIRPHATMHLANLRRSLGRNVNVWWPHRQRHRLLVTAATCHERGSEDDECVNAHDAWRPNDQAQRPPPETPGRLQQSLTNYLNRPTAQRGGGSLQRPC